MTADELLACLTDRPCEVCKFRTFRGCSKWSCVFEGKIEELPSAERKGHWIFNPSDAIEMMFAKPKCSECGFESADGGNYCSNCGARMDSCENASEITRKSNANRWIPCEKRLPEVGEQCLLTVHYVELGGIECNRVIIGVYSDNYKNHILAWMPLPKAYEGGTE